MEYVALKWSTIAWCDDRGFLSAFARLRERGWEEHSRAYFEKDDGGACIMRKPKDQEVCAQEFEYVALCWFGDTQKSIDACLKERLQQLTDEGWEQYIRAPWIAQHESGVRGGACIMRRSKDEPRKRDDKYEYLATPYSHPRPSASGDIGHDEYNRLYREGWRNCGQAPWGQGIGGVFVWRREREAEDRKPNWSVGYPFTGGMPGECE